MNTTSADLLEHEHNVRWVKPASKRFVVSLVKRLESRELFGSARRPGTAALTTRQLHSCLPPNATVVNVEKPIGVLPTRFTPDGRLLLAFNRNQNKIEIYEYRGVTSAGQLLHGDGSDDEVLMCRQENNAEHGGSPQIRARLFETIFRHRHTIDIGGSMGGGGGAEQLRECCLITADSRHAVFASSQQCSSMAADGAAPSTFPSLLDFYQNNESLTPNNHLQVEDIKLYSVDIQQGRLCDQRTFKCDKIFLSHNHGLYLCNRLLAVLSVQHQTIHMFQVDETNGSLVAIQSIGRFLFDDDELRIQPYSLSSGHETGRRFIPVAEAVLTGLKQRLLTFMMRRAKAESEANGGDATPVRRFFQYFDHFRWLKVFRMQMLDANTLLLRFSSEDSLAHRGDQQTGAVRNLLSASWYVFYDWRTTRVLAVYDCYSRRLLEMFEKCADQFRHPDSDSAPLFSCSISSCAEARDAHERLKQSMDNARGGGADETVRLMLAQLPIPSQSFSQSPYLDPSLFHYDDRLVSAFQRPKPAGDTIIRFYHRRNDQLAFQLHCGLNRSSSSVGANSLLANRQYVAILFHPTDPFAISTQRANTRQEKSTEWCKKHGTLGIGDEPAVINISGSNLDFKILLATITQHCRSDNTADRIAETKLKNVYRNVFKKANDLGCKTVTLPGFSTGQFGMPPEMSATAAMEVLSAMFSSKQMSVIDVVRFVDLQDDVIQAFHKEIKRWQKGFVASSIEYCSIAGEEQSDDNEEAEMDEEEDEEQEDDDGASDTSDSNVCPVCAAEMDEDDTAKPLKTLDKCHHKFHLSCINHTFKVNQACCPVCQMWYAPAKGTQQPTGARMKDTLTEQQCPGFPDAPNTIMITYTIPSGVQTKDHPRPGTNFQGAHRIAYLPNNPKGQAVLQLLRIAFNNGLTFTVGDSGTTGIHNVVMWNAITHKTNIAGGPQSFGYPDPTYLDRVKGELAAFGITE